MSRTLRIAGAVLLVFIILGGTLTARLPGMSSWVEHVSAAVQDVSGPHGYAIVVLLSVVTAVFGFIPASLMAIAAGVAYGLWIGFLLAAIGTLFGGWVAFLLSRSILRPWIARLLARRASLARLDEALTEGGWRLVCLLRMSPVMPFAATSYSLGLTQIDQRSFLIGTLASLPALFCYVAVGAMGHTGLAMRADGLGWFRAALLMVGTAATILAAVHLRRILQRNLAKSVPTLPID